jgi:hypothetical protein
MLLPCPRYPAPLTPRQFSFSIVLGASHPLYLRMPPVQSSNVVNVHMTETNDTKTICFTHNILLAKQKLIIANRIDPC